MRHLVRVAFVALVACTGRDPVAPDTDLPDLTQIDADLDGSNAAEDCDDHDGTAFPGAREVCNGVDDDCDGAVDDADPDVQAPAGAPSVSWYVDADGDGFGAGPERWACALRPAGASSNQEDCDDTHARTYPGAAQLESPESCRRDADGDGFGAAVVGGDVASGTDCDDTTASVHPGARDAWYDGIDSDCEGNDDWDRDRDGHAIDALPTGTDCDDNDPGIHPDATDVPYDGVDQDCSGADQCDVDGDGHRSNDPRCGSGDDCEDDDAAIHPDAVEVCDRVDNDCDGKADDADPGIALDLLTVVWVDADRDGYGDPLLRSTPKCTPLAAGYAANDRDCDDKRRAIKPGATEICNGLDDDCDGATDDADASVAAPSWYADVDGDGARAKVPSATACASPPDTLPESAPTDCDDADAYAFPGAAFFESATSCRRDGDLDGFGTTLPGPGVRPGGDCADDTREVHPWATEQWYDGLDQNCDGQDDWDQDGDGFPLHSDCDDAAPDVHPDAIERCNDIDDDCDASVDDADEDLVVTPWGFDLDGDGQPGATTLLSVCERPAPDALEVTPATLDCDDDDALTYIGAAFRDDDAACMTDADGDGWGTDLPLDGITPGRDCDDLDAAISPDADELFYDLVDQNCAPADEWDADGDGVASEDGGGTDCDDAQRLLGSFTEDADCDGIVDDADCRPDDPTNPCTIRQVVAGARFTCILFDTGQVRCWGSGERGRTGLGTTETTGDDEAAADVPFVDIGRPVTQLAASTDHACALTVDNTVRCWGNGEYGKLGYGNTEDVGDDETPASVGDVDVGADVVQISAGHWMTCALTTAGSVRCWGIGGLVGYPNAGAIGDDEVPADAGDLDLGPKRVVQVSVGHYASCAVFEDGATTCWGNSQFGTLGQSIGYIGDDEAPSAAGELALGGPVARVAASYLHVCALLRDGGVICWGYRNAQLGLADPAYPNALAVWPTRIPGLTDAVDLITSNQTTCVRRASGLTRCWGWSGTSLGAPPWAPDDGGNPLGFAVRAIASGGTHSCAIGDAENERLRCWGSATEGPLGLGMIPSPDVVTASAAQDTVYR